MTDFSILDTALTGFRVVRQHPKALLAWWLFALALALLVGLVLVGLAGPDSAKLQAVSLQRPADPAVLLALLGRLAPAYLVLLLVGLASNAVLTAAMIRAVLQPQDDRFGYLRLGADEVRQLGLGLLAFLVFAGVYFGVVIVVALVGGVLTVATKTSPMVLAAVLVICVLTVMAALAVRLSLASALTFDSRRVNLFGSWTLTRGRFWRLFAAYLLVVLLVIVVYALCFALIYAIGGILSGGGPNDMFKPPDAGSLASYFSPARLAQTVLNAAVSALMWPVFFSPAVAIYRAVAPGFAAGDAFA
jgi:hypothetical protein